MPSPATFDEVLDAVEHLSPDQQADLLRVIQRRLAQRGRQRVVEDVREARLDFDKGKTKQVTVDDILREADA